MNELMQNIQDLYPYDVVHISLEQRFTHAPISVMGSFNVVPVQVSSCAYTLSIECHITQYQMLSDDQLYDLM